MDQRTHPEIDVTVLEVGAPAGAGGFSAAIINGRLTLTTWCQKSEISIQLTASEMFQLRDFLNGVIESCLDGSEIPEPFIRGRL